MITLDGLAVIALTQPLRSIDMGECALSTGDELWWIGPIADLAMRRHEFPKADTLTCNGDDVEAVRAMFGEVA